MRMSLRTLGLLIALIGLVAAITLLVSWLISSRSGALFELARPLVEPVAKDISAERGWQNTSILLDSGDMIQIQFMSGEIRDGEAIIRGPSGTGYICGDSTCCEPMPEAQRDALIGRVGDHIFLIGDKNRIEVQESGELQLRINDCDEGLFDNAGSLTVKISP
jgi:hypothetical protein